MCAGWQANGRRMPRAASAFIIERKRDLSKCVSNVSEDAATIGTAASHVFFDDIAARFRDAVYARASIRFGARRLRLRAHAHSPQRLLPMGSHHGGALRVITQHRQRLFGASKATPACVSAERRRKHLGAAPLLFKSYRAGAHAPGVCWPMAAAKRAITTARRLDNGMTMGGVMDGSMAAEQR